MDLNFEINISNLKQKGMAILTNRHTDQKQL